VEPFPLPTLYTYRTGATCARGIVSARDDSSARDQGADPPLPGEARGTGAGHVPRTGHGLPPVGPRSPRPRSRAGPPVRRSASRQRQRDRSPARLALPHPFGSPSLPTRARSPHHNAPEPPTPHAPRRAAPHRNDQRRTTPPYPISIIQGSQSGRAFPYREKISKPHTASVSRCGYEGFASAPAT
jgi:hypothetical protein